MEALVGGTIGNGGEPVNSCPIDKTGVYKQILRVRLLLLVPFSCSNVAVSSLGNIEIVLGVHLGNLRFCELLLSALEHMSPLSSMLAYLLLPVGSLAETTSFDEQLDRLMQSGDSG